MSVRLSTRAVAWRLDRADGVRIGFTSHDRRARIDGLSYLPQPGLAISSIRRNGAFEPGGLDVQGAIDSALLGEADLLAGRWHGAEIVAFSYDWEAPEHDLRWLMRARIGRLSMADGVFKAELLETRPASKHIVPRTTPGCRAIFTGTECGLSPARFRHEAAVVATEGALATLEAMPNGGFARGKLRWLGGPNRGLRQTILAEDGVTLHLDAPPVFAAKGPQRVELIEGCDHSFTACAWRFDNALNFRGEPHLPGMDFLTRYPGN